MELSKALAPTNTELSLPTEALAQLRKPSDYEHAFQMVAEQMNSRVWWIADLIASYTTKFPKYELDVYRNGQQMSQSAYRYYQRTAFAFPPETRNPALTFSHHYQASWADEYNRKDHTFNGDKRFDWLAIAMDKSLSSRALGTEVAMEKRHKETGTDPHHCIFCLKTEGQTFLYSIYKHALPKTKPVKLYLHEECFATVLQFADTIHDPTT
jgi:hypothetical protein